MIMIDQTHRLLVDLEYIQRIGILQKNFTQTGDRHFIFSHSCENDRGSRTKKRANFFQHDQKFIFHCYHCGESSHFSTFLKNENEGLYREYLRSLYSNKNKHPLAPTKQKEKPQRVAPKKKSFLSGVKPVVSLKEDSPIRVYLKSRGISENNLKFFGMVEDFPSYYADITGEVITKNHTPRPRIVIPYLDESGTPFMAACRTLPGDNSTKYMYVFKDKDNLPDSRVYGLWRVDTNKKFFVTEGQFDSLFLSNAISIGGTNYSKNSFLREHKDNAIIVPDNDWRVNKEVRKSITLAILAGFSVAFLPQNDMCKDINDFILAGYDSKYIENALFSNVMSGMKAIAFLKLSS